MKDKKQNGRCRGYKTTTKKLLLSDFHSSAANYRIVAARHILILKKYRSLRSLRVFRDVFELIQWFSFYRNYSF